MYQLLHHNRSFSLKYNNRIHYILADTERVTLVLWNDIWNTFPSVLFDGIFFTSLFNLSLIFYVPFESCLKCLCLWNLSTWSPYLHFFIIHMSIFDSVFQLWLLPKNLYICSDLYYGHFRFKLSFFLISSVIVSFTLGCSWFLVVPLYFTEALLLFI